MMDTAFVNDMLGRSQAAQKEINEMGFGPDGETKSKPATIEDPYWNAPISELKIKVDKRDPRLMRVYVDGELWEKFMIRRVEIPDEHRYSGDPEFEYDWVTEPCMRNRLFVGPNSTVGPWNQATFGRALASYLYDDYYGDQISLLDRMNPELRQVKESK